MAKSRRPKKASNLRLRRRWLLWGGAGLGLLVVVVGCGGMAWLAFGWRRGGGPQDVAAAREPTHGQPGSWVPPIELASADRATWRVTADEVAPLKGLHSAYEVPTGEVDAIAFATAKGQAGVVVRSKEGALWVRYDLRQPEPVARVPLKETGVVAALSPSGDRLAVRDAQNRFFTVWSKDGKQVGAARLSTGGAETT
jgi:hypothetical protein